MLKTKRRVLAAIADGSEAHGYAIAKRLGLRPSTVYEHLRELETAGLISSHQLGRRRTFRLTEHGKMLLEGLGGT